MFVAGVEAQAISWRLRASAQMVRNIATATTTAVARPARALRLALAIELPRTSSTAQFWTHSPAWCARTNESAPLPRGGTATSSDFAKPGARSSPPIPRLVARTCCTWSSASKSTSETLSSHRNAVGEPSQSKVLSLTRRDHQIQKQKRDLVMGRVFSHIRGCLLQLQDSNLGPGG
jgi:hypothetical protein